MLTEVEKRIVGALRQIAIAKVLECRPCDGTGRLSRGPGLGHVCPECSGTREVLAACSSVFGAIRPRPRRKTAA